MGKWNDFFSLVKDKKITVSQGKEICYMIIDGDKKTPSQIAESLGFLGDHATDEVI